MSQQNEIERATTQGHWVIKKEISVGDIIAFVVAFLSVITAYFTLDKRLTVLEVAGIKQGMIDSQQDTERITLKQDIHAVLDKIDVKLDWIIQNRVNSATNTRDQTAPDRALKKN